MNTFFKIYLAKPSCFFLKTLLTFSLVLGISGSGVKAAHILSDNGICALSKTINKTIDLHKDEQNYRIQSEKNEDVSGLVDQLHRIEQLGDCAMTERLAIVEELASMNSEEALDSLAEFVMDFDSNPYAYEAIVRRSGSPSQTFLIAERASEIYTQSISPEMQSSSKSSPVALLLPALTGSIFELMSSDTQEHLDQGTRVVYLRVDIVAALASSNQQSIFNELITLLPAEELTAILIEVIDQGEYLWCGMDKETANKTVSFSNNILKQIGPQFVPSLTEAAQLEAEQEYSDAAIALIHLAEAFNDDNLDQQCGGCCGSWGTLYQGVVNILRPKTR